MVYIDCCSEDRRYLYYSQSPLYSAVSSLPLIKLNFVNLMRTWHTLRNIAHLLSLYIFSSSNRWPSVTARWIRRTVNFQRAPPHSFQYWALDDAANLKANSTNTGSAEKGWAVAVVRAPAVHCARPAQRHRWRADIYPRRNMAPLLIRHISVNSSNRWAAKCTNDRSNGIWRWIWRTICIIQLILARIHSTHRWYSEPKTNALHRVRQRSPTLLPLLLLLWAVW